MSRSTFPAEMREMTDENTNPWETLKTEVVYENNWISVHHHDVITPGGHEGIYGVVTFKNLAIGIIPIDSDGNTWLVGQYRYALNEYSWEIPMGGGPLEEDPLLSAQRELKEETGIVAQKWRQIMTLHTSNSVTDEVGHVYIASDLSFHNSEHDDTEQIEVKKMPFEDVYDMVLKGQITDAISIAGILKAHILLNNK